MQAGLKNLEIHIVCLCKDLFKKSLGTLKYLRIEDFPTIYIENIKNICRVTCILESFVQASRTGEPGDTHCLHA